MKDKDELETLTTKEAADVLCISETTCQDWARKKKDGMPAHRRGKGYIFFKKELLAWLKKEPTR